MASRKNRRTSREGKIIDALTSKGCLLGESLLYYLINIDDYYVAAWAGGTSKNDIAELVQEMLHRCIVCFAFKNNDKQTVIDLMLEDDRQHVAKDSERRANGVIPRYKGYPGRKRFFALYDPAKSHDNKLSG